MADNTEPIRRILQSTLNAFPGTRESLEAEFGQVWDTTQLQTDFEVLSFLAPFVHVRRRADNVEGTLMFQGSPRFYFSFTPA